jgi:predicted short-subunit dehydrogenase-like oxidoreductase (DUF2520 family)
LERAGHRVVAASGGEGTAERIRRYLIFTNHVDRSEPEQAARQGTLVVIAVPDDDIEAVTATIAEREGFRPGQHVLHLSGSLGLHVLRHAADAGADVLSLHPLQSFPDIETGIERLPGSSIAVTARDEPTTQYGESLARDLHGVPFRLAEEVKPLYHCAAVFCSNYLVAVEGVAEELFRLAGIEDPLPLFEPLARAAFEATFAVGSGQALTGPAARGDAGTISRNLEALTERAPDAIPAYVALAEIAAGMAERNGRLAPEELRKVVEVLDQWR